MSIRVKIINNDEDLLLLRQLKMTELYPEIEIVDSNQDFTIYHHIIPEDLTTIERNSFLILGEPYPIRYITKDEFRAFDHIITSQFTGRFKDKIILSHQYLPNQVRLNEYINLTELETPKKDKLLSVICSPKEYTSLHLQRIKFTRWLQEKFGDNIDIYGLDSKFDDKIDALGRYHMSICLENTVDPHSWTEKFSDCLITRTVPLYSGCININEYFKYIWRLNIYDFDQCYSFIKTLLDNPLKWNEIMETNREIYCHKQTLSAFINKIVEDDLWKR